MHGGLEDILFLTARVGMGQNVEAVRTVPQYAGRISQAFGGGSPSPIPSPSVSVFSPFAPPFMHASEAVFCVPQPFHFFISTLLVALPCHSHASRRCVPLGTQVR